MTESEIRADERARIVAWLRSDPERLARVLRLVDADPPSAVLVCVATAIEHSDREENDRPGTEDGRG